MGVGNSFGFVMRGLCAHAVRGENPPGNVNSKCSYVIVASCVVGAGPTLPTLPLPEWKNNCQAEKKPPLALLPYRMVAFRESSKYRTKPCYGPASNPRPPSHSAARFH